MHAEPQARSESVHPSRPASPRKQPSTSSQVNHRARALSPHLSLVVSPRKLRPGRQRWRHSSITAPRGGGLLLKSATKRTEIISAYREVGTYHGAAQVAGTTHKTVKWVIARHEAGGGGI